MRDALFAFSLSLYVMLMLMVGGGAFKSNNKATFYTDTEKSPFLRGRRSIVPYVSVIFLGASANSGYDLLGARTFLEVGVGEFLCIFFLRMDLI